MSSLQIAIAPGDQRSINQAIRRIEPIFGYRRILLEDLQKRSLTRTTEKAENSWVWWCLDTARGWKNPPPVRSSRGCWLLETDRTPSNQPELSAGMTHQLSCAPTQLQPSCAGQERCLWPRLTPAGLALTTDRVGHGSGLGFALSSGS